MKICHLILTHSFAGSERYAIELANAQAAQHEVTLVLHERALEDRPQALGHRVDPRVRIERIKGPRLFAAWQARRRVKALRPDVAHAHLSAACKALHGLAGLCLRVATLHIHYKPQQHAGLDALIALTPGQLAAVPEPLRHHTAQIDNWTQGVAASREQGLALRRQWGVGDDEYLIGALGRVERSKGLDVLLQASRELRQQPGVRLAIVGAGRDFDEVRRLADPAVLMPGFHAHPEQCFAAFDLFVSAAREEPFGLVFLEAMRAGLPVLATSTEGGRHLGQRYGWPLVPPDDVPALRAALGELVAAHPPRRNYDLSPFSLPSRLEAIEAFYRRELAALKAAA